MKRNARGVQQRLKLINNICYIVLLMLWNTPTWAQTYICQDVDRPHRVAGDPVLIVSDSTVTNTGELTLIAPTIELLPGFKVKTGGVLEMFSQPPCPDC